MGARTCGTHRPWHPPLHQPPASEPPHETRRVGVVRSDGPRHSLDRLHIEVCLRGSHRGRGGRWPSRAALPGPSLAPGSAAAAAAAARCTPHDLHALPVPTWCRAPLSHFSRKFAVPRLPSRSCCSCGSITTPSRVSSPWLFFTCGEAAAGSGLNAPDPQAQVVVQWRRPYRHGEVGTGWQGDRLHVLHLLQFEAQQYELRRAEGRRCRGMSCAGGGGRQRRQAAATATRVQPREIH